MAHRARALLPEHERPEPRGRPPVDAADIAEPAAPRDLAVAARGALIRGASIHRPLEHRAGEIHMAPATLALGARPDREDVGDRAALIAVAGAVVNSVLRRGRLVAPGVRAVLI